MSHALAWAVGGTGFTFLMTSLGAAMVFFFKKAVSANIQRIFLGFAAGVMIAASVWSLLIPAMEEAQAAGVAGWLPAGGGFVLGVAFLMLLDSLLPHLHPGAKQAEGLDSKWQRSTMLMLAVTLHNIPEGMAVGLAFALAAQHNDSSAYAAAMALAVGMGIDRLVDAIRAGVVDAISTDHAPHSEEDKLKGMAGMVGSETAFGVCYTKLCKEEGLPLELLVRLMSTRPAEILGLAKGQLEPGYDGDFVLVDLEHPYTVDKDKLHSKSHNTPFDGAELYGKVYATVKGGKLTYQAE